VTGPDLKADLHAYLRTARAALEWKLEGLSDYDVRRPLVPTGTNLLGLVKHLTTVEWGHFGAAFGQPSPAALPWVSDEAEPDADMWAAAEETRADVLDLYRHVCAASDAVIDAHPLDAVGQVPWWPAPMRDVTLQHILIHTIAEAHRHAGHADIVRELIDGAAGFLDGTSLLAHGSPAEQQHHRARLEQIAREADQR
jgi:uncharacterized damage-inducible protein DinB